MNLAIYIDALTGGGGAGGSGIWDRAILVLADSALKGVLLLALAGVAVWLLRRRSAAARHLTWLMALTALLLLPALSLLVPEWRLPILPAATAEVQPDSPAAPTIAPQVAAPQTAVSSGEPQVFPDAEVGSELAQPFVGYEVPAAEALKPPTSTQSVPAALYVLAVWLAVALLVLAPLPMGLIVVAHLRRKAVPLDDEPWTALAASLARSLRLARPVRLLMIANSAMPMAAGFLRPAILLPREARDWPADKRRVVLLHELAHVRRFDCFTHAVAHVALAMHWFNPLAWLAMRRLTTEREQACDDMVLTSAPGITPGAAGSLPSDYAGHLLDIARTTHAGSLAAAAAVTMARRSQLEGRLRAILDTARPRSAATRRMIVFGLLLMAALILPLASIQLGQAQAPPANDAVYKPIAPESQPTSDITGIVKNESGQPVTGAEVLAVHGWEGEAERRTTQTDADGRFNFGNIKPDGYWFFSANHPRYAWQWDHEQHRKMPTGPETLPVEITLVKPWTLRGSVVDADGKPVAGVEVMLKNQILLGDTGGLAGHGFTDALVVTTDEAGRFTMNRLRPGEAFFVVKHPDYALTEATAKVNANDAPVTFTIDRGMTLEGRIVHDGRPLANVAVHAEISEYRHLQSEWDGRTDAQGRFRIERIPPLDREHRGAAQAVEVSVARGEEKWWSNIYGVYEVADHQLPPVTIEAKPREPGEHPWLGYVGVGKRVGMARSGEGGTLNVAVPGFDDDRFSVYATLLDDTPWGPTTQSLKDGKAVFEDLPPGPYRISIFGGAHHTNRPSLPPKVIEVVAGQTANITLEPGPLKTEGVVRSGGKLVERGYISWFASLKPPGSGFQGGVEIQPDGSYSIEGLTEGRYRLLHETFSLDPALRNPHRKSMRNVFTVELRDPLTTFDIDLPSGRIEGRLIGRTPKAPEPERGSIGSIRVTPRNFNLQRDSGCFVEADADGRFIIDHVPPGEYTISGYGLATSVQIEREGSVVAATLRPPEKTGEIAGRIAGGLEGIKDERHEVYINAFPRDEHGYDVTHSIYLTQPTPKTGTFRIRNLPVGTYMVALGGYRSGVPSVLIPDIEVREGLSRELVIELPPSRTVSLFSEEWQSVTGWRVRMPSGAWANGASFGGPEPRGIEHLLPLGEYTAEVSYGDRGIVIQTFTVKPGEGTQKIILHAPK